MPKIRKKTSKRGSTRMREKVKHKVKESHKKAKKEAKKDVTWKSRVKKDIGIPNLFPYKEQVLAEQQEAKERKLAEKQVHRLIDSTASTSATALAASIEKEDEEMELDNEEIEIRNDVPEDKSLSSTSSLRIHAKSLKKVINLSDVLIEVLDARDPLGTRSIQLEKEVIKSGKKILLILNKVDLIPKENVESWLKYLRRSWPTLPFKCSTQSQRSNLCSKKTSNGTIDGSSNACSTQPLMHLLKNYARYTTSDNNSNTGPSIKSLASITVGVIGFPNVGKSSLINTLKRSKACPVAPTPGHTKEVQEISLEKGLKILDCPGVVMDSVGSDPSKVLRNVVKIEQLSDPFGPIGIILKRCKHEHLMLIYNISAFSYPNQSDDELTKEFLIQVARSRGRVKKGGIPDLIGSARSVLRDWNSGRIPYYTVTPPIPELENENNNKSLMNDQNGKGLTEVGSAKILNEYGIEFDFEALFAKVDNEVLGSSKSQKEIGSVVRMKHLENIDDDDDGTEMKLLGEIGVTNEDEDEEMEVCSTSKRTVDTMGPEIVSLPPKKSKQVTFEQKSALNEPTATTTSGFSQAAQLARMGITGVGENKKIAKQARKDKKKAQKLAARSKEEDEEMQTTESKVNQSIEQDDEEMDEQQQQQQQPYSFADFFQGTNAVAKTL
ncbi:hypothetical protein CROQUDRAFT_666217 [Cronartium quercuum f. sp. fusiforme G11]|uniref:CP-type G domain-containing protein n=1 Tax=Cronartium quercuum f. sp. fusiforme G11 TaxID=708437 RepID=A0A9P6N5H9_9BASI|nr:hypothetical protein CROQUDRAFT_666217 [Cronartium quercuum f. sp. fusiforme G11]